MRKDKEIQDEIDIYTDWDELLCEDEITDKEAAFMFGYDEEAVVT